MRGVSRHTPFFIFNSWAYFRSTPMSTVETTVSTLASKIVTVLSHRGHLKSPEISDEVYGVDHQSPSRYTELLKTLRKMVNNKQLVRVGPWGDYMYGLASNPPPTDNIVMCVECTRRPAEVKKIVAKRRCHKHPLCRVCAHKLKETRSLED